MWTYKKQDAKRVLGFHILLLVCILVISLQRVATWPLPKFALKSHPSTRFIATPCRFQARLTEKFECGDLLVPEDRSRADSPLIRLHVVIIHSPSDHPQPDPVIFLEGGPGAHALDSLSGIRLRFAQVLADRDLIVLDQRGVGYSEPPLNCPELDYFYISAVDRDLSKTEAHLQQLAALELCRVRLEQSGINLPAYNAAAIAADVADLRAALGYETWNLYGVSYGAGLALLVMQAYPQGLRSVVLDAVRPLQIDVVTETAVNHAHALDQFFADCEADPACLGRYPDLEASYYALVAQLDAAPLSVRVPHPRVPGWTFTTSFDGADLLQITLRLLRVPQGQSQLLNLLDAMQVEEYGSLARLLQVSNSQRFFSEGMYLSVTCPAILAGDLKALMVCSPEQTRIYDYCLAEAAFQRARCALWLGEGGDTAVVSPPTQSDIPTLILAGGRDTVTPLCWAEATAAALSHSKLLIFPTAGHPVLPFEPRAWAAVAAFYNQPESCGMIPVTR